MRTYTFPLIVIYLVTLPAGAQETRERSDLELIQRQFTAIDQLADRAKNGSENIDDARYRFDYLRFAADLDVCVKASNNTCRPPGRSLPT
jgi:RAQPRD family integrative conjugative element protein